MKPETVKQEGNHSQAVGMSSAANSALEQLKNLIEEHEGKVSMLETDEEETDPERKWTTKERKRRKSQKNREEIPRKDKETEDQEKSKQAFKAWKKYKTLHSVKPNLKAERKRFSEEQLRDQDDATEKCNEENGLLEKGNNPIHDFGTPSEEAMNNEWPDSQTIPGTQDLEKFDEKEIEFFLNEDWPNNF